MKRILSWVFALCLFLTGCSEGDIKSSSSGNLTIEENNTQEDIETTSSEFSDQPFIIEDCVPVLQEFANGNRYAFNITIRNNSGQSIDSPTVYFDFMDVNQDILWSKSDVHSGIIKDGQSYIASLLLSDSNFEFDLVDQFKYASISSYDWFDDSIYTQKSISQPQLFSLSS